MPISIGADDLSLIGKQPGVFMDKLKEKLKKEPELSPQLQEAIALKMSADKKDIEHWIADSIVSKGLESGIGNGWFQVTDERNIHDIDNKTATASVGLYKQTMADSKNWSHEFSKFTNDGRYGTFIEKLLFRGGAGSAPDSDIVLENGTLIEVKTLITDMNGMFNSTLTAGKFGEVRLTEYYKSLNNDKERALFLQELTVYKYMHKMQNLLLMGYGKGAKSEWNPIKGRDGWVQSVSQFYISKLIYFYYLIAKVLIELVEKEITVDKVAKSISAGGKKSKVGGLMEVRKKENLIDFERFEVKIRMSDLPNAKEIRDVVEQNAEKLYAGKKVLFDMKGKDDIENAEQFFKRILTK